MKILYGITYYLPHISGLTRCLKPISERKRAEGHETTIIAAQADPELPIEETIDDVRVVRVPVSFWVGKGPVMLGHARQVAKEARDADIVHLFLPQFDAGPAALIGRLRGSQVILTYVCSFTSPGFLGAISRFAARLSHLVAGLVAHRIVALSEDYANQSLFCRMFRRKLSFVPIPIPDYPARADPRRDPKPPYRIGFVGRIAVEKNIDTLLDALPHLRRELNAPFALELVGPMDDARAPRQEALRNRLDTEDAPEFRLLGQLSEQELDAFYRDIDVLVLPSTDRIEAYGLVQVEAMLRGTPCVTSDRPGMREPIALTGFGETFAPGDAEALAKAVAAVLKRQFETDPDALYALFHPTRIDEAYSKLYSDMLGPQRPSAV